METALRAISCEITGGVISGFPCISRYEEKTGTIYREMQSETGTDYEGKY
jgi:hypothetical protein